MPHNGYKIYDSRCAVKGGFLYAAQQVKFKKCGWSWNYPKENCFPKRVRNILIGRQDLQLVSILAQESKSSDQLLVRRRKRWFRSYVS